PSSETTPRSSAFSRSRIAARSTERPMPALSLSRETCMKTIPISAKAISPIHARPVSRRSSRGWSASVASRRSARLPHPGEPSGRGAGGAGDLVSRRREAAAGQQRGLCAAPAGADRQVGRAYTTPCPLGQEALHTTVFKRVERNPCKSPARNQERPRQRQGAV